jgi:hypothetical protein
MERRAFPGTERYRVDRLLGSGGYGDVYEAFDRARGERVALKTLRQVDAGSLARFKNEFRALADILHPNLVMLHELVSDGTLWFFTMELVEGGTFEQALGRGTGSDQRTVTAKVDAQTGRPMELVGASELRLAPSPDWLGKLLSQLVAGLRALHDHGQLHRDIKPSNVLVDREGRVVIVDFGLVSGIARGDDGPLAGTLGYMAPETSIGRPATEASDWYSFGALLYEALTGRPPFDGAFAEVLHAQHHVAPTPPSRLAASVPPALESLCLQLLRPEPTARPGPDEILAVLAALGGESAPVGSSGEASTSLPFVGREAELEVLADALREAARGRFVVQHLHGPSGVGKSALVERFVEETATRLGARALVGRCYERESVPFKALDGLMDALARAARRGDVDVRAALSSASSQLVRTFPALDVASGARDARHAETTFAPDEPMAAPAELRRRLSSDVRAAFERLAAQRPLVLVIDDVQWGDVDSATLLAELGRDAPGRGVLLLACGRGGAEDTGAFVRTLVGELGEVERRTLALGPLGDDVARALARTLLPTIEAGSPEQGAARVARESGGNPFLIQELARHARAAGGALDATFSLDALWRARVDALPAEARELLRAVALAGRPIDPSLAHRAAGFGGSPSAALRRLSAHRLVRDAGHLGGVVTWHDRVRDAVVSMLAPDDRAARHLALADAYEAAGPIEPETLANHLHAGGDLDRAGRRYAEAAARAAGALAFARAAELYRLALRTRPGDVAEARALRVSLAEALADAGRGPEAASEYLAACEGAEPGPRLLWQQRAAAALIRCGHLDRGLPVLRDVLRAVGVTMAETPTRALALFALQRARLRLRGLDYTPRDAAEIPEQALLRIDACWTVATALGVLDVVQSTGLQALHLRLALDAGEPVRVARGLAAEAASTASAGAAKAPAVARIFAQARAAAEKSARAEARGTLLAMETLAAWAFGRWPSTLAKSEEALRVLRERCADVSWELAQTTIFHLDALIFLGAWDRVRGITPDVRADARERGDLYLEIVTAIRAASVVARADDDVAAGQRALSAIARWPARGRLDSVRLVHLHETMELALYAGEPARALDAWRRNEAAVRGSHLQRVQLFKLVEWNLLGLAELQRAAHAPRAVRGEALRAAAKHARALEGDGAAWGAALAILQNASAHAIAGREEAAIVELARAEASLDALGMRLHAEIARRARGGLVGGDAGTALRSGADAWLEAQRIRSPARLAAMLAPGIER